MIAGTLNSGMYKLVHDPSYAEYIGLSRYIVVKVYDGKDQQVGQIKLEVLPQKDPSSPIAISIQTQGNLTHIDQFGVQVMKNTQEFHPLEYEYEKDIIA